MRIYLTTAVVLGLTVSIGATSNLRVPLDTAKKIGFLDAIRHECTGLMRYTERYKELAKEVVAATYEDNRIANAYLSGYEIFEKGPKKEITPENRRINCALLADQYPGILVYFARR